MYKVYLLWSFCFLSRLSAKSVDLGERTDCPFSAHFGRLTLLYSYYIYWSGISFLFSWFYCCYSGILLVNFQHGSGGRKYGHGSRKENIENCNCFFSGEKRWSFVFLAMGEPWKLQGKKPFLSPKKFSFFLFFYFFFMGFLKMCVLVVWFFFFFDMGSTCST